MGTTVYLLLGSNEGDREQLLRGAIADLEREAAIEPAIRSQIYETAAWGVEEQPPFLNVAVEIITALAPVQLLRIIKDIEARYGRQRSIVWGQRTLDIDILLYGNEVIFTPELIIPHPRMADRRFALVLLCEIAGHVIHPSTGRSCRELLNDCADPLPVQLWQPQQTFDEQI